ncbi:MAG: hypothetical protein J0J01_27660 [Reyranella sp.]|uniref:hypothetical protein n=1 Tax=Reyranella sp. TaxID=1929291 RepID=UPI001ACC3ABD|nr:hypothetical protein [Reyranella sp.]MBN9090706.1 hypothetical protein [Reyranella sp.]
MSGTLLTPQQLDAIGKAIAGTFKLEDFTAVLDRYTGHGDCAGYLPARAGECTMVVVTDTCLGEIKREGTLLPFLSRVVEHKWQDEKFRATIVERARALVRPALEKTPHVTVVVQALNELSGGLAVNPQAGTCQNGQTCTFVRDHRNPAQTGEIDRIVIALDQFEALKRLHDSLHILQVQGADWLDEGEAPSEPTLPLASLKAIVETIRRTANDVQGRVPEEANDICRHCLEIAIHAASALGSSDADQQAFALAELRLLVTEEPPRIDGCIFGLSRELPIKQLRGLLESAIGPGLPLDGKMQQAAESLDRVTEAMRANILEHALWQVTDIRIAEMARILANPGPGFLNDLSRVWRGVRQTLRTLVDAPEGGAPFMDAALNGAMVLYEAALPTLDTPAPSGPSPTERFGEIVTAFTEFRLKTRVHFLAVDQTLKLLFASLLPMRDALKTIRTRVPQNCACPP